MRRGAMLAAALIAFGGAALPAVPPMPGVNPIPPAEGQAATANVPPTKAETHLFTYFTGNGEDGLHLARSDDGTTWRRVGQGRSYLAPQVGGRLMRDPSIVRGRDGRYHLVWTTGWWDRGFGVAHSADLRSWSAQAFVTVFEDTPGLQNVWAPEIHHDAQSGDYVIVWASTIAGRFPETALGGDQGPAGQRLNHRLYATTTRDFVRYTPARLFYDGGFSAIDGVVVAADDGAVLVVKDETRFPEPRKHLRIARAASVAGPFGPAAEAFSPAWVEGPTVLRLGHGWRIYYDEYTRKRYGSMDTRDFRTFTPVPDVTFPDGMRHGTAFSAPVVHADALER